MTKKLEYLQIARGIAAVIVVLHHLTASTNFYFHVTPLGNIFKAGWNGVDFFFVLSGFIIYLIHDKDIGKADSFRLYALKRIIRIYPIYWLIALVSLALLFTASNNVTNGGLSLNLSNPVYVLKSLLLIQQQHEPFLGVAWSLCFEIFFYLLFGLAILFGRSVLIIFTVSSLTLILNANLSLILLSKNSLIDLMSSNYNLDFLIGILTAYTYKKFSITDFRNYKVVSTLGITIFILTWVCSILYPTVFGKTDIASRIAYGLSSGIIILGISNLNSPKESKISNALLVLGDASYALYLVHPLVLAISFKVFSKLLSNPSYSSIYCGIVLVFVLCLLTGILIHLFIEAKILKFLNRKFIKPKVIVSTI